MRGVPITIKDTRKPGVMRNWIKHHIKSKEVKRWREKINRLKCEKNKTQGTL